MRAKISKGGVDYGNKKALFARAFPIAGAGFEPATSGL
jgi:hypothetical protein